MNKKLSTTYLKRFLQLTENLKKRREQIRLRELKATRIIKKMTLINFSALATTMAAEAATNPIANCTSSLNIVPHPVYIDIILSPRCPGLNQQLFAAINRLMDLTQSTARISVASIGAPLPTTRTPDSLFASSILAACAQQVLPEEYSANQTSSLVLFLQCSFGQNIDKQDDQEVSTACMNNFNPSERLAITTCASRTEMLAAAKSFARSLPTDYYQPLPLIFIDGSRYCGRWDAANMLERVCLSSSIPQPPVTGSKSTFWPAPRMEFDIDQACPPITRFPGDYGAACLTINDKGGVIVELVPVIGLLFLIFSAFSLGCMILFRRRFHQRARRFQNQRNVEFQNDRILDIMQFLALIAAQDLSGDDLEQHKARVEHHLSLLPVKSAVGMSDTPPCTICFESADTFYDLPCGHIYHQECLKAWFDKGKAECPVCRLKVIGGATPLASSSSLTSPTENARNFRSSASATGPVAAIISARSVDATTLRANENAIQNAIQLV
jgi:hypothetical protein